MSEIVCSKMFVWEIFFFFLIYRPVFLQKKSVVGVIGKYHADYNKQ